MPAADRRPHSGNRELCLQLDGAAPALAIPVADGDEAQISFRHSVYGSSVREHFRLLDAGLQLARVSYAELRLAEFYGHETARLDGSWWVVPGRGPILPFVILRVTSGSEMAVAVGRWTMRLSDAVEPGGRVRLTVRPSRRRPS